jgi:hypothetical protein
MEQKRKDKDHKDGHRIIIRRVRPRYKKALIPALIISLIIAIILILIMKKYFLTPIFEGRGSMHWRETTVVVRSAGGMGEDTAYRMTKLNA